jgi:hypothetical protein
MTVITLPIDIESPAFAVRLGDLLTMTRRNRGRSLRTMAAESDGRFDKVQLKLFERGGVPLHEALIDEICRLYNADLGIIVPTRQPVVINGGFVSAGGVTVAFIPNDAKSLLSSYLRLIRAMRQQRRTPAIMLRRDDIEQLAAHLHESPTAVLDRLTLLMGSTAAQRTAMASMFATGAIVIGLAAATVVSAQPSGRAVAGASGSAPSVALAIDRAPMQPVVVQPVAVKPIIKTAPTAATWPTIEESRHIVADTSEQAPVAEATPSTVVAVEPVAVAETPVAKTPVAETAVAAVAVHEPAAFEILAVEPPIAEVAVGDPPIPVVVAVGDPPIPVPAQRRTPAEKAAAIRQIYATADADRQIAIAAIDATTSSNIRSAASRIYATGGADADALMAAARDEIYTRADALKTQTSDRIDADADAAKAAILAD